MIGEVSHFFSILASGLFFLSFVFSTRTYNGNHNLELLVSRVFSYGFSFILISFLLYVWLAIQSDFSIRYIAEHSNKDLPIFYKISSILLIIFFDLGLVNDANVSSTLPSLLINIL